MRMSDAERIARTLFWIKVCIVAQAALTVVGSIVILLIPIGALLGWWDFP